MQKYVAVNLYVHLLRIETLVNGQVCHEVHLVRCQPPDPVATGS